MIATLTEIKKLLQLNDSTYDEIISALIPIVENKIFTHCKNHFINTNFDYVSSSNFVFAESDNSISFTNIGVNYKLVIGDTIRVYESFRNDGVYTIDSMTTNKLILNPINQVQDENEGQYCYLTTLKFPISLKMSVASMVNFKMRHIDKAGIASEKIDDYQVNYPSSKEYPDGILVSLNDYRCVFTNDIYRVRECYND
jgi:hypothetical protein